jgi:formylmethanofuran dehydrogenase subunit E
MNEDNNFNSTIICNNCGQKFEKTIRRLQNNHITCPKCNKFLIQYVNAKTESIVQK